MLGTTGLPHPSECELCLHGLHRMRQIARLRWRTFPVKTWCRVCGMPVLVEVKNNYGHALRYAYRLDDAIMEHHGHEERGNWGVHWRLDEVLRLIFPTEHREDVWPTLPWYEHGEMMDQKVIIADEGDEFLDQRRRELITQVNTEPKTRSDLEHAGSQVWDSEELAHEFSILGFCAPFVVVERYSDGARGSLMYQHDPRFYFEFRTDRVL